MSEVTGTKTSQCLVHMLMHHHLKLEPVCGNDAHVVLVTSGSADSCFCQFSLGLGRLQPFLYADGCAEGNVECTFVNWQMQFTFT